MLLQGVSKQPTNNVRSRCVEGDLIYSTTTPSEGIRNAQSAACANLRVYQQKLAHQGQENGEQSQCHK